MPPRKRRSRGHIATLPSGVLPRRRLRGRERSDDLIRLYVLPTFGDLQAAKLDAELLERFCARLHRCRDMCTGRQRNGHTCRPLSSSTTRKVHDIIRGALDRAVRWRHLGVNKAAMAVAPSPRPTEPDPPNAEEAARLLNAAWSDPEWGLLPTSSVAGPT